FGMNKSQIVDLAVKGAQWVKDLSSKLTGTNVVFQYSPESFSSTEVEFALEVCEAVMDAWSPTPDNKMIINLPETVEVAMPNVYADQIEWFCRNMKHRRSSVIISLHTHNDRGTGVAATEQGLLAGADRVEGTLFGNGERTGNVDIVTVALNMMQHGIDPGLDFSNLDLIREVCEECTGMKVPPRHPYSGQLVFTAFSGSHQDAIRKGLRAAAENPDGPWNVPYLTIDPKDLGREYEEVIRVNGQSGKAGVAYLLEHGCGIKLPKEMIAEFGPIAGKLIDKLGREVTSAELREMLWKEYVEPDSPYGLEEFNSVDNVGSCSCSARVKFNDSILDLFGNGNGPLNAFIHALHNSGKDVNIIDQAEHTLGEGSEASAIAYVQLKFPDGFICWGAGVDTSIQLASIRAVISALNRE
ncbi:MAG: 2-isopropylmalate synthase, partial [Minisyncoccia bacterium]